MARKKPTGASRVDRPANGAVGWLMRIRRGGTFVQEFFSDAAHGGKRKSQLAAQKRYAELSESLPAPSTSEGTMSVRNSSGVVGVRLAREGTNAAGEPRESYVASWREGGQDKTVRFSCSLFGKRKAFQLACLARDKRSTDRDALLQELGASKGKGKVAKVAKAAKKAPAKAKKTAKKAVKAVKKAAEKVAKKAAKKAAPAKKAAKKAVKSVKKAAKKAVKKAAKKAVKKAKRK